MKVPLVRLCDFTGRPKVFLINTWHFLAGLFKSLRNNTCMYWNRFHFDIHYIFTEILCQYFLVIKFIFGTGSKNA